MRGSSAFIVTMVALGGLTACGTAGPGRSLPVTLPEPPDHVVPDDYTGPFRASDVTVLSSPEHAAQLCTYVEESYPPGCEGPDVVRWAWSAVEHESAHGTSWGSYHLVGTWDDGVFTLTEPATTPQPVPQAPYPASDCPEPPGGWEIPDPTKAGPDDQERVVSAIGETEGYAGAWLGWLIPQEERTRQAIANPENYVLNVLTTGDPAAMETTVRKSWGGKLCVTATEHTSAELDQIVRELSGTPGLISIGSETRKHKVTVGTWVATESLWEELAGKYGADVIDLQGVLQPIEEPLHK